MREPAQEWARRARGPSISEKWKREKMAKKRQRGTTGVRWQAVLREKGQKKSRRREEETTIMSKELAQKWASASELPKEVVEA